MKFSKDRNEKNRINGRIILILLTTLFFISCATNKSTTNQQIQTSLSKEIKEIHPGILEGYLPQDKIPNSLKLIPPPPEEGSTAFLLDKEIANRFVMLTDEGRKEQAKKDAELAFPQATEAFNIILDIKISKKKHAPFIYDSSQNTGRCWSVNLFS